MKKAFFILLIVLINIPINTFAESKEEIVTLENCIDYESSIFINSDNELIDVKFAGINVLTDRSEMVGNYICSKLKNAKEIKIEYEEENDDKIVAWVFIDDVLLQDILISNGYSNIDKSIEDSKYYEVLNNSLEIAKEKLIGMWEEKKEETKQEIKEKKKNFFQKLIDDIIASIFKLIDDILEFILKTIEDML